MAQLQLTDACLWRNKSTLNHVVVKTNGFSMCTKTGFSCVSVPKYKYERHITIRCQANSSGKPTGSRHSSLPAHGKLKAVIFDVDGTLCDSDPLHHKVFVELLKEVGFQGGEPISEEFFIEHITGRDIAEFVDKFFPEWDQDKGYKFMVKKDAQFRSLALKQLRPLEGLGTLCQWIKDKGLRTTAVTNAPRENAELMISILGLTDFFETLIVGSECDQPKPFPDPYLKALDYLKIKPDEAFVFEDSSTGLVAAVSAGMAAVGLTTQNPKDTLINAGASFTITNYNDPKLWEKLKEL